MNKRLLPLFAVLLFFSMRTFADPIHGIVVTDGNKPVPFAYVMTEGKKYATQADKEGRFTLNVPSGATIIFVSILIFGISKLLAKQ